MIEVAGGILLAAGLLFGAALIARNLKGAFEILSVLFLLAVIGYTIAVS